MKYVNKSGERKCVYIFYGVNPVVLVKNQW